SKRDIYSGETVCGGDRITAGLDYRREPAAMVHPREREFGAEPDGAFHPDRADGQRYGPGGIA
ncbi:MAG: hypothetical protein Q7J84_04135, partial [Sulfuricaulis sp.]|nr:hypothetical protein [Sulfuricaulis sp.]